MRRWVIQLAMWLLVPVLIVGAYWLTTWPSSPRPRARGGPRTHAEGHAFNPACPWCRDRRETIPGIRGRPDGIEFDGSELR